MGKIRQSDRTTHLTPNEGLLSDLSAGGACLNLAKAPKEGSIFKLQLNSKDIVCSIDAKVINVREIEKDKFNAGIQFVNMSTEITNTINEILDNYGRGVPIKTKVL